MNANGCDVCTLKHAVAHKEQNEAQGEHARLHRARSHLGCFLRYVLIIPLITRYATRHSLRRAQCSFTHPPQGTGSGGLTLHRPLPTIIRSARCVHLVPSLATGTHGRNVSNAILPIAEQSNCVPSRIARHIELRDYRIACQSNCATSNCVRIKVVANSLALFFGIPPQSYISKLLLLIH